MATVIRSLGITGITGYPMGVEVAIIAGMPGTTIVGLGDSAVKEAKDRMEACTEELGYAYPTKKVVVNLSPSDIRKLKVILMHLLSFDHVLFNHFRIVSDQLK